MSDREGRQEDTTGRHGDPTGVDSGAASQETLGTSAWLAMLKSQGLATVTTVCLAAVATALLHLAAWLVGNVGTAFFQRLGQHIHDAAWLVGAAYLIAIVAVGTLRVERVDRENISHVIVVYDRSNVWLQNFVWNDEASGIQMLEQADVLDYDSDGNTTEITRIFYHRNALGSVMEITDLNQATAVSYRYDPYGRVTITRGGTPQTTDPLGQGWTFTARFNDEESGLLYCRTRYFSVTIGRFLQRAPLGHEYYAGPNLYEYAGSSPTSRARWDWISFLQPTPVIVEVAKAAPLPIKLGLGCFVGGFLGGYYGGKKVKEALSDSCADLFPDLPLCDDLKKTHKKNAKKNAGEALKHFKKKHKTRHCKADKPQKATICPGKHYRVMCKDKGGKWTHRGSIVRCECCEEEPKPHRDTVYIVFG